MNRESNTNNKPNERKSRDKLSGEDVKKHSTAGDCWVIVHGKAYDVTEFMPEHPGGPKIILKYAGLDATVSHSLSGFF